LLLLEPGAVLAKWMNRAVPYDVLNDFTPIALVATQPLVLFAQPSLPVSDVKELIAYCRANPASSRWERPESGLHITSRLRG
jgi:tripartite-type tricarboxylate transporter receptor subunit TctC